MRAVDATRLITTDVCMCSFRILGTLRPPFSAPSRATGRFGSRGDRVLSLRIYEFLRYFFCPFFLFLKARANLYTYMRIPVWSGQPPHRFEGRCVYIFPLFFHFEPRSIFRGRGLSGETRTINGRRVVTFLRVGEKTGRVNERLAVSEWCKFC